MNSILNKLGRRLRLGMIGGGPNSFAGPVHRTSARISDYYDLMATVLSSDPEKSALYGTEIGIVPDRAYGNWQDMLQSESGRNDKIEVVAILTPNSTHYEIASSFLGAGVHVICEKPLCTWSDEAQSLVKQVEETRLIFCVTFNYSAYPMVRHARAMVKKGEIGEIKQVHLEYIQGNLAEVKDDRSKWRFDSEQSGPSLTLSDIGSHALHMGSYVTGADVSEIMADIGRIVPGNEVDDYSCCLLRYENGAHGSVWATKAASGAEHGLSFKIFGEKGGLEWHQETPNELLVRRLNDFKQIPTRRSDGLLSKQVEEASYVAYGHPEGFQEAFANLYRDVAKAIVFNSDREYPKVEDGAKVVKLVEAAVESSKLGTWVSCGRSNES